MTARSGPFSPPAQVGFWSRAADVLFGLVPAVVLLPYSVVGLVFCFTLGLRAFAELASGWPLAVLSVLILAGICGWFALITAIFRRWRGALHPSPRLRFGLWCGVAGSLCALLPWDFPGNDLTGSVTETFGHQPLWLAVLVSPLALTLVYLYRLRRGGQI